MVSLILVIECVAFCLGHPVYKVIQIVLMVAKAYTYNFIFSVTDRHNAGICKA